MATKIRLHTSTKKVVRAKRKKRIRSTLEGTAERPRLSVFRSNLRFFGRRRAEGQIRSFD